MIEHGVTSESNGHSHSISNPASGFTDPHLDGHRHRLVKGCSTCAKVRKLVGIHTLPTDWQRGHLHYFNSTNIG